MISNHIIGVGGTGTKCVDAMVHLAACGLFPDSYVSLFDQDMNNGNLAYTRELLDFYAQLVKGLGPRLNKLSPNTHLFQTKFARPDDATNWYWLPFEKPGARLDNMFQLNSLNHDLQHLSRCLFNLKYELGMDLTYGFRGRPAVGSAVISGSRDEGHRFWNYVEHLLGSAPGDINVFLAGSVFGGTGAAGLPTIARQIKLIEKELWLGGKSSAASTEAIPSRLTVGAAMMLPYFTYADPPPSASAEEKLSIARASELPLRSQLALDFYARTLGSVKKGAFFDAAYLLGLSTLLDLGYINKGGHDQRNPALFLEIYAGLAASHFLHRGKALRGEAYQCGVGGESESGKPIVRWRDLPSPLGEERRQSVYAHLGQLVRFAFTYFYVYHAYLFPETDSERRRNSRESWYKALVSADGRRLSLNDETMAKPLNDYCLRLLEWYASMGLTPRGRSHIDLEPLIRIKYAKLVDAEGEPPRAAPSLDLLPPVKARGDRHLQDVADAFDALLGEENVGGLEHIYEGLCRQQTSEQGFAAFVNALWCACALVPSAEK